MVLTFQNLRYLLDSCLPILDKGLRLLDKDFLAVLTSNRSALSECAAVLPRVGRAVTTWWGLGCGFVDCYAVALAISTKSVDVVGGR